MIAIKRFIAGVTVGIIAFAVTKLLTDDEFIWGIVTGCAMTFGNFMVEGDEE